MKQSRRKFIRNAGLALAGSALSTSSYGRIMGANDRLRVGVVGFSDRARNSLLPAFQKLASSLNFEIIGVSDIWSRRRDEGVAYFQEEFDHKVTGYRNNEELYEKAKPDAVIISTADFQHALHAIQAVEAGCDVYVEKPFAETMADNRAALKTIQASDKIVQIGSQRRSGNNYHAAHQYLQTGAFGDIVFVEMSWNVNQPGRWRRPQLLAEIRKRDVDWKRYQLNRPRVQWDPRKYLEYRLFWPYSSGIPGQWMCHQIDTVHWFTGLPHPRSVTANGGIYLWKDGRTNYDTMTAVFDYGPLHDASKGFQVRYSSRFSNSAGGTKEIYYSNGGELNLDTNQVSSNGGLQTKYAEAMNMKPNLLESFSLADTGGAVTDADTGEDDMTLNHMRNWMECLRSRATPNAPVKAGYEHAIATIMANAAVRTRKFVTFDEDRQEVLAGGKVFHYS